MCCGHRNGAYEEKIMNMEKLTERARGFIQAAQTIAIRENHQRLAPEHLQEMRGRILDKGRHAGDMWRRPLRTL
jgi:hypothetical protein